MDRSALATRANWPAHALAVAVLLGILCVGTAPAAAQDGEPALRATPSEAPGWTASVHATEEVRLRSSSAPAVSPASVAIDPNGAVPESSDQDARLFLRGGLDSPTGAFTSQLSAGMWLDMDGRGGDPRGGLSSMQDGAGEDLWFDVYALDMAYHSDGLLRTARAGRMRAPMGPATTIDGAAVELGFADRAVALHAFGGRTHHFYEVDAELFEDWTGSVGTVLRPAKRLRIELDYRFQREDITTTAHSDTTAAERVTVTDHGYGAQAWYRPSRGIALRVGARGLGADIADIRLAGRFGRADGALGAAVDVRAQPTTLDEVNEGLNAFHAVLAPSLPHLKGAARLWSHMDTSAGLLGAELSWRERVLLEGESTTFNRSFGGGALALFGRDLATEGLSARVAGEAHFVHTDDGFFDGGVLTASGSLGYETDWLGLTVGTSYAKYTYDYYLDVDEMSDVRSVFTEVEVQAVEWLRGRLRYSLDSFDRDVHTVLLTLSQTL